MTCHSKDYCWTGNYFEKEFDSVVVVDEFAGYNVLDLLHPFDVATVEEFAAYFSSNKGPARIEDL